MSRCIGRSNALPFCRKTATGSPCLNCGLTFPINTLPVIRLRRRLPKEMGSFSTTILRRHNPSPSTNRGQSTSTYLLTGRHHPTKRVIGRGLQLQAYTAHSLFTGELWSPCILPFAQSLNARFYPTLAQRSPQLCTFHLARCKFRPNPSQDAKEQLLLVWKTQGQGSPTSAIVSRRSIVRSTIWSSMYRTGLCCCLLGRVIACMWLHSIGRISLIRKPCFICYIPPEGVCTGTGHGQMVAHDKMVVARLMLLYID